MNSHSLSLRKYLDRKKADTVEDKPGQGKKDGEAAPTSELDNAFLALDDALTNLLPDNGHSRLVRRGLYNIYKVAQRSVNRANKNLVR